MIKKLTIISGLLLMLTTSCTAIGSIFKAGAVTGIVAVVIVLVAIVWIIWMVSQKS